MIKYLDGNLFDFIDDHNPVVIAHIVNNQGAFGAGFVIPLGQKYPVVKQEYLNWHYCKSHPADCIELEEGNCHLGHIQVLQVEPHVRVCNMVAQTLGGQRPLYYNHLCTCMDKLAYHMFKVQVSHIICPQFGSGLAGGDWNVIEELITDCWIRAGINVTVVRYKK